MQMLLGSKVRGAAAVALIALAGWWGAPWAAAAGSQAPAMGTAGHDGMTVTGAYVPLPSGGSSAAAYLVLHNHRAQPDRLLSISTSAASVSMVMSASSQGMGNMKMPMPVVRVPAHGTVTLTAGHDYVRLQGLAGKLKVGQKVTLTLKFVNAGTFSVVAPVVAVGSSSGMPASSGTSSETTTAMSGNDR
jgi:copper(I)-binding protein